MKVDGRLELASQTAKSGHSLDFFVAGLSYKTAPVEFRERLALDPSRLPCRGCRLKLAGGLSEVVLLSTCNRVEIYGVGAWGRGRALRLFQALIDAEMDVAPYLYVKEGLEATEHLFAVASGMDSMVIGETEITGQVKLAYQAAQEARLTGRVTNRLFQAALQTAKTVRTETAIGRGATSVGSVAVELAERIFDHTLADKTVLIIGAGKMGEACVRHLSKKGARSVLVVNRSLARAEGLAREFGGRAAAFEDLLAAMAESDIVVSSTGSPRAILNSAQVAQVMRDRRNRPLFLIDIAVPRDIDSDVQHLANVYLYNVDHLESLVRENTRLREQELSQCREIIGRNALATVQRLLAGAPRALWTAPGSAAEPSLALRGAVAAI